MTLDPASAVAQAAVHFAAQVDRRSKGQLKIEVYPSGQLANEPNSIAGLTTGTIDLSIQATPFLEPLFPKFQVFDLPFMFKSLPAAFRVLDGPIGDEFLADLDSKGIVGLSWGAGGFKELESTNKPITVPEDMKGLRMRIPNGAVYVATYQALGAIPIPIDNAEVLTALSQRVIDAVDFNIDVTTGGKFYIAIKHLALSNHILSANLLLASKRKVEALPPALQRILKDEGKRVVPFWRALFDRQIVADIKILKENGVVFSEIQYSAFRKAVEPVYALFQTKLGGDLIERVSRAAGGGRNS